MMTISKKYIPDKWIDVRLGDILTTIRGVSFPKEAKHNSFEPGLIACLRTANVQKQVEWDDIWFVSKDFIKREEQLVQNQDILISTANSLELLGKVAQIKNMPYEATLGTFIVNLRINQNLSSEYIYYCLSSLDFRKEVQFKASTTTNISNISTEKLKDMTIPLPPLSEQRRIVAKIEELFSELDKGVELLKTLQQQLKVYRQAVLEKYTNLGNKIAIKDCITDADQGWSPKCLNENTTDPEVWAVISTTAIQTCKFNGTENKILPDNLLPRAKHEIQIDDILITRAGPRARCGVSCLVKNVKPRLLNCDKVYRLKIDKSKAIPQFIEYVLNSPSLLKEIENCKTGGNDSGVNLTKDRFLNLLISLPSIEKQKYSIAEIASRLSVADKVEETIDQSLQQAEALRQSILKKAFEGRLLSTAELEEIRQEPDWEPASVLLERIKAQKSAPDVSKPPAKQSSRKGKKHS